MGEHDDWFDDFMEMKMLEEDESDKHAGTGNASLNGGCLPVIIGVSVFLLILKFLG